MRITQIRKDIEEISKPILTGLGFIEKGSFGESIKSNEVGEQAILLDCIKDSKAFSVSIRAFLRYDNIECIFEADENYTINTLVAAESIAFESYSKEFLKDVLHRLISNKGMVFLSEFGAVQSIISNLSDENYKVWVTSDKVAQFKIRLATAVLSGDSEALAIAKCEAAKYCAKPWSEHNREIILGLCACV